MGDMHVVATYTGWKDFGGTMAPAKIVQTRGGWPFFEVDIAVAKVNPPMSQRSCPPRLRRRAVAGHRQRLGAVGKAALLP